MLHGKIKTALHRGAFTIGRKTKLMINENNKVVPKPDQARAKI